jgi:hypothetical protein
VDVAAQSVELGDDDGRASQAFGGFDRGLELWPGLERVSALAGFDLDELLSDIKVFQLGKGFKPGPLGVQAKA